MFYLCPYPYHPRVWILDSGTGFASGWSEVLEVLRVMRESLLGGKGVLKEGVFSKKKRKQ